MQPLNGSAVNTAQPGAGFGGCVFIWGPQNRAPAPPDLAWAKWVGADGWPGPRGTRTPGLRRPAPPRPPGAPARPTPPGLKWLPWTARALGGFRLGPLLPRQPQRLWAHWLLPGSTPTPPPQKGGSPMEEEAPKIAWGLNSVRPEEASGPPTWAGSGTRVHHESPLAGSCPRVRSH